MKSTLIWIAVFTVAAWWWMQPPSASRIIANTQVSLDGSSVEHKGLRYTANWGERTEHIGDLRVFSRAHHKAAPFITHEAVLTTGQFSDPSVVEVSPIREGSMYWTAQVRPTGTLIVLHFIPADSSVLANLKALRRGDHVRLTGHEVSDQQLAADPTHTVRLTHNNHRFLLLTEVALEPDSSSSD